MLRLRTRHGSTVLAALLFLGAASSARAQVARYNHSITLMSDGNVIIAGGQNTAGTPLATVDIRISTGAKYETRAVMTVARASHTATLLPDGRLLVTGGISDAASVANCDAGGTLICARGSLFDPRTNAWANTGNEMSFPRYNHTATMLPTGKVLITGGQINVAGNVTSDCDLFNPATNNFEACGAGVPLQMARAGHTATLLHNGRVFVAGGYRDPGVGFSPTTEIYNPVTDAWESGPAIIARAYHTATQMGNQRVLIAGGYNGVNLLENQGILSSTEIFDPNSGTVTPGQPMAERKMHHTANLLGTGNVDVFGGLGNITTTYFTGDLGMQPNSTLALTPQAGSWLVATVNSAPTNLFVKPDTIMSVPATGVVVDGHIDFSSPTMTGSDFKVDFTYPAGTIAPIDGATIDGGKFQGQTFEVSTIGGNVVFIPQTVSSDDMVLTGGSQLTTAGAIQPAVVTPLTGGTLNGTLRVPMPATNVGGTVVAGAAIITNGAMTRTSGDTVQGFDVALTSGVAPITGGTVINDPQDGPVLVVAVSFTGIAGDITSSTTTNIATPVSVTGLKVTGLQVKLQYVVSPLNVEGQNLKIDIATTVVKTMVFADQERYRPNANSWAFGIHGDPLFNHAETLLPNGDEFVYGGRVCTSVANCSAFVYTAFNARFAYIVLQESDTPWTSVGTLSAPRSNLTLTQLPDGRVLAAGGADASTTLDVSEVMNPATRFWTTTSKMKRSRSHHSATLLPNGTVLAVGGFTALGNSTGTTNHAEIFYPAVGAWVPTSPMASSRAFHGTVLLPDGNPMVMGGFSNGAYLSSTEVFYSTAHRWYPGPAMPEARGQYTATMMRDGRIMVIGGLNAVSGVLNTTRFFDPQTLAWAAGPNLLFGRHSHTATLLRDGRVFVVGGNNGGGEIGLGEIYDPALNVFQRVATTLGGNELGIPRQNHTATLLPDGKVMIVGGFTALGGPISYNEGFDVDFSSFQMQGQFTQAGRRGDHSTLLMPDGFLLSVGGFDGLNYLSASDVMYYGASPDVVTQAGGSARRPQISAARPAIIAPGTPVTAVGTNFRGVTEASGGGAGSGHSSHAHPRVYMNRADAASASANDSGWMIDLSSGMFNSGVNSWANMDSSLTFTVPGTQYTLPFGWYNLRVAANDQFSVSTMVQVGPQVPTSVPGVPSGTAVGPSSVVWTWAAAGGAFDGYSVYSATSGVFLSTIPKSGGGTETFLQRDLGPDSSTLIRIAAYNISGDGLVVAATVPVLTAISAINGLQGFAQDARTIFWSWDPISGALGYDVYSTSAGVKANVAAAASFTQTGLSTNTASSIRVQALMPGGNGELSVPATAFTLAAAPAPGSPPINFVSTGSIVPQWLPNDNPSTTRYHIKVLVGASTAPIHISSVAGLSAGLTGGDPNTLYTISVAAFNGDGRYTGFTALGSTYTLARPPVNARIVASDPSGVSLAWDRNNNPGTTPFQILYSSDNFVTDFSTHIAFSADYTTATTNISSLITGKTYTFRVTARNAFGQETSAASTQAFTDNGGGPPGSLSLVAPSSVAVTLAGTLGSGRRFEIRVPGGTFDVDTRLFIASRAVADLHPVGTGCGAVVAGFSITNLPAVQPRLPVEIGLQYIPAEPGLGALATLGVSRFDPGSGSCVPMESRVDIANNIVYARINHFSDFQLQQLVPGASAGTARVFPNPLYTNSQGFFTFDHLPANAHVRVFTLHGEEVFDQSANSSGIVTWRPQNKSGRNVASGLYLAVIESGGEKKIMKLAVVR